MSYPETPAQTDSERIALILDNQRKMIEVINNLGQNLQWIIDQATPILQMTASPMFQGLMPDMQGMAQSAFDNLTGAAPDGE